MQLLMLHGVDDGFLVWYMEITEKVSLIKIVLRNIKRTRRHHQKSHIWLASHIPDPWLVPYSIQFGV